MITTDYDTRLVNCYNGKLEKVFVSQRVIQSDSEKVAAFCEGTLQRKYYLADGRGLIECFNSLNGEQIKMVNDPQEDIPALKKIAEILNVRSSNKNSEIPSEDPVTCMTYLGHENRLVVGTQNSIIKMYDESQSEASSLYGVNFSNQVFLGGHVGSSITTLACEPIDNLLASGSENGLISLWDLK